jgi:hypothetical protein
VRKPPEPPLSPEAQAAVDASLKYQHELRAFSVWHYPDPKKMDYPRFVAVIKDKRTFNGFRRRGETIRKKLEAFERPTRWLPTFLDETWLHASLSINTAYESYLLSKSPYAIELNPVSPEAWEEKEQRLIALLPEILELPSVESVKVVGKKAFNTYGYRVIEPRLVIRSEPNTLSYRRLSGRAFRLRGLTDTLEERAQVKLGILVLRGFKSKSVEVRKNRKPRSDMKTQRLSIGDGFELVVQ